MPKNLKTQGDTIYEMQAELCGALANPVRLRILELVSAQEMTSAELQQALDIPKTNLSQHLTVLRDAGILQSRREGLYQYMSLALPKIKDACAIVKSVLLEKIEQDHKRHTELRKELKAQR